MISPTPAHRMSASDFPDAALGGHRGLEARSLACGVPGRGPPLASDLCFRALPGTVLALLGPNGAGKTTLLRTLLGLSAPRAGEVLLDGHVLARLVRRDIAARVGYVPQHLSVVPHFRVDEWVLLGRLAPLPLFAVPGDSDWQAVNVALAAVGMEAMRGRRIETLSGGEQRLVAIARALAQGARMLVLDEPAAGLDYGHEVRLLARIDAMRAQGFGIVFSSHDPRHALEHADQVLLLDGRGAARLGAPRDIVTSAALSVIYEVPVHLD